jgi:hypothetical protein
VQQKSQVKAFGIVRIDRLHPFQGICRINYLRNQLKNIQILDVGSLFDYGKNLSCLLDFVKLTKLLVIETITRPVLNRFHDRSKALLAAT